MKELKFRVWDNRDKKMYDVNFMEEFGAHYDNNAGELVHMQYVGFDDKNSSMIFEGDVLEVAGGSRITVEDLSSFLIYCGRYEEKHGVPLFDCLTVVGNIYEANDE